MHDSRPGWAASDGRDVDDDGPSCGGGAEKVVSWWDEGGDRDASRPRPFKLRLTPPRGRTGLNSDAFGADCSSGSGGGGVIQRPGGMSILNAAFDKTLNEFVFLYSFITEIGWGNTQEGKKDRDQSRSGRSNPYEQIEHVHEISHLRRYLIFILLNPALALLVAHFCCLNRFGVIFRARLRSAASSPALGLWAYRLVFLYPWRP